MSILTKESEMTLTPAVYRNDPERQTALFEALASGVPIMAVQESNMIGDTVISTGLLRALMAAQQLLGNTPQATLLVRPQYIPLLSGLQRDGITLGQCDEFNTVGRINDEMSAGKLPCGLTLPLSVMNFHDIYNNWIVAQQRGGGKSITSLFGGLSHVLDHYSFSKYGYTRFARAVEAFSGLPEGCVSAEDSRPRIYLPADSAQRYQQLAERFDLPRNPRSAPSVGCVITASHPEKRYGVDKYMRILKRLSERESSTTFSVYYDNRNPDFQTNVLQMQNIADEADMLDRVRFISEPDLVNVATMMAQHQLVLSNDTGLAHIAAALDVPTISLFSPFYVSDFWVSNKHHYPIDTNEEEVEKPGAKAPLINLIPEEQVLALIDQIY